MDKVILITGASSGIGEGIARELGRAGARLLLGARRLERVEAIAAEMRMALRKLVHSTLLIARQWPSSSKRLWRNGVALTF